MRIGFDSKRAFCNRSGLGNYARGLLNNLFKYYPEHFYYLYTPKKQLNHLDDAIKTENIHLCFPQKKIDQLFSSLWRSTSIRWQIQKDKIDIYHGLSHEIPFSLNKKNNGLTTHSIKQVVTMHDLIYLRYPEFFPFIDRTGYDIKFRYACRKADHIIAVSQKTQQDLIEFFGTPEKKISVIYQNCGSHFYQKWSEKELFCLKEKFQLHRPYALFVGNIEPRKNCLNLIKAFAQIPQDINIELILVGAGKEYKKNLEKYISENQLSKRVRFLGFVPDEDMPGLYQGAHLFIYPALFEGFGVPLVEALHSEVPIVTSKGNPFAEVAGEAALLIDPHSLSEIKEAMIKLSTDSLLAQSLKEKAKIRSSFFLPAPLTQQLMKTYENVLG